MKHKVAVVFVLCLAAVAMLSIGATPAGAAAGGLPEVAQPGVAYVDPSDGDWWSGGNGWGGYTLYLPGTPIPAQDFVTLYAAPVIPDKPLLEQFPQILLASVTVRAANGELVVKTTEEQSAQFWGKIAWSPVDAAWYMPWQVPLGQLSPGTYQVTFVVHLTTTVQATVYDETGNLVTVVIKANKEIARSSFTVQ
jgi:hypothetical protein